jgi:hypothetical protein
MTYHLRAGTRVRHKDLGWSGVVVRYEEKAKDAKFPGHPGYEVQWDADTRHPFPWVGWVASGDVLPYLGSR